MLDTTSTHFHNICTRRSTLTCTHTSQSNLQRRGNTDLLILLSQTKNFGRHLQLIISLFHFSFSVGHPSSSKNLLTRRPNHTYENTHTKYNTPCIRNCTSEKVSLQIISPISCSRGSRHTSTSSTFSFVLLGLLLSFPNTFANRVVLYEHTTPNAASPKDTETEKSLYSLMMQGVAGNTLQRFHPNPLAEMNSRNSLGRSWASGKLARANRWNCSDEIQLTKSPAMKVVKSSCYLQAPPKKPVRKCSIDAADALCRALQISVTPSKSQEPARSGETFC